MNIRIFQIDAFTDQVFKGNPAAVCILESWIDDEVLMSIARENNLAETAYIVPDKDDQFHIRWFTPEIEMDLCGHATLASAYVMFEELGWDKRIIKFNSQSGPLHVSKVGQLYEMNFPSRPVVKASLPDIISKGLSIQPQEVYRARDYLLLYENQEQISNLIADKSILDQINLDPGGIIITAIGAESDIDFVSRFFTPQAAIFEDPVTGSAHCSLIPFWAERLAQKKLKAKQISQREGLIHCTSLGERVLISGNAVKYMEGNLNI